MKEATITLSYQEFENMKNQLKLFQTEAEKKIVVIVNQTNYMGGGQTSNYRCYHHDDEAINFLTKSIDELQKENSILKKGYNEFVYYKTNICGEELYKKIQTPISEDDVKNYY